MSRISWLVAAVMATGVVGCAQCDTCDDFPAPCVGPNCGQGGEAGRYTGGLGYLDSMTSGSQGMMGMIPPGAVDQPAGTLPPPPGPAPSASATPDMPSPSTPSATPTEPGPR